MDNIFISCGMSKYGCISYFVQDAEEVVLQGEKEAEKMIVEAYAALLLAFLSTERFFLPLPLVLVL